MTAFLKILCFFFIAHTIGDAKAGGTLNQVTHKAAHGALAVASAKLTGRDAVGAAIGAVASETAAEAMDKPGVTHEERQKIAQKARLVGDTVAFLAGRDVASADSAGRNAVENNFLPDHLVEIDGQRALMKLLPEEIAAEGQKRLDLDEQVTIEAMKNPYLNMVALGIAAGPGMAYLAPALNHATLATGAYLMSNPTGMKVASLATKGAVTLGTGILAYDYGQTAVNRGFGAAFHRMQEDAGLIMSVPSEVFVNATKSVFPSAPQEAKAAKTLVQETRPVLTESTAANRAVQTEFGFVQDLNPSTKIGETVVDAGKRWSKTTEFKGTTIHQRDSFIDPLRIDPKTGKTNYELMKDGNAPIGPDGKAIELHHVLQTPDEPLVEITNQLHTKYKKQLHINPDSWGSAIDRTKHAQFRKEYWKERAKDFEEVMKNAK